MKSVLLIGLGRFGRTAAMKLRELNHEVMAVDIDEKRVSDILPYVTNGRIGDCTDEEFLKSLGVRNYDLCMVTIGDSFQDSLETTSLLKEMGAPVVISRASSEVHAKFLKRNGADEVVFPEQEMANWAAIRYSSDHLLEYIELDDTHSIYEVAIPEEWLGKTIVQLDVRRKYELTIIGIRDNDVMSFIVKPDTVLTKGMSLLVLGEYKKLKKCFKF
jgi:trk system potassium uptake protein TrkA